MNAIVVEEFGGPEVLQYKTVDRPEPGSGEVLVKMMAAGVNPVDTYIRTGTYAQTPVLPYTPGKDGAGTIAAVGSDITDFSIGDRVFTADSLSGTYAEYSLCRTSQVGILPDNISFEQGAAVFVPYATAYRALFQKARPETADWILVHGASGGVGIAAIQWAKHAGFKVIGTAGSKEGVELVSSQGADFAFNHTEPDYLKDILEATQGNGVNVILEMLANVNLVMDFDVLAKFGKIVVIGNRGSLDFNPRLTMGKDASIFGMALFNYSPSDEQEIRKEIFSGLSSGYLKPVIGKTFSLANAAEAHRDVIGKKAFGKLILIP